MSFHRNTLLLLVVLFGLTSCMLTEQINVVQIEVMKPGVFIFPENIKKVAVFKRDSYKSDTCLFKYLNSYEIVADSTIKSSDLSNQCVDALTGYFDEEAYFQDVKNYRDSLNSEWNSNPAVYSPEELFSKSNADILIFLDFFKLYDVLISNSLNHLHTSASLSWTITIRNDTVAYIYNQIDTLHYDDWQFKNFNLEKDGFENILMDAAKYLGESFGKKIIPSWIPVERMYYTSNNPDMLKAEKYGLQNEWIKAAERWNPETKNKNPKIVAKACYNMALAAEMEGEIDVAIDWLVKSYSALPKKNQEHKANCQRYISVLAMRKKEIERLEKQVRKPENK
ncbi:MAG: DUF6340 family protein [Bacteroidota bacterium]|nr:hypothetical protein [Odoribacter sp.]MDP3643548.1 DUF6340 family protein [Bacteroidota bacterium]